MDGGEGGREGEGEEALRVFGGGGVEGLGDAGFDCFGVRVPGGGIFEGKADFALFGVDVDALCVEGGVGGLGRGERRVERTHVGASYKICRWAERLNDLKPMLAVGSYIAQAVPTPHPPFPPALPPSIFPLSYLDKPQVHDGPGGQSRVKHCRIQAPQHLVLQLSSFSYVALVAARGRESAAEGGGTPR